MSQTTDASDFQLVDAVDKPQKFVGDGLMIDHAEWLGVTLGPQLAPVRRCDSGRPQYVFLGAERSWESDGLVEAIEREVSAFESAVRRLHDALIGMLEYKDQKLPAVSTGLLALRLLLEVHMPHPDDRDAMTLRDDRLQLGKWGLESGVALRQVMMDLRESKPGGYTSRLRTTLRQKYAVSTPSAPREPAPAERGRGQPERGKALAPSIDQVLRTERTPPTLIRSARPVYDQPPLGVLQRWTWSPAVLLWVGSGLIMVGCGVFVIGRLCGWF